LGLRLLEHGMTHSLRTWTAWRGAVVAVALNLIGMPVELAIQRKHPAMPVWPPIVSMAAAGVLLGILLIRRRRRSLALANAVFLVNLAVIVAALWMIARYPGAETTWNPFQEFELGMVTCAILAPELWIGLAGILVYASSSLILLATIDPHALQPVGEPWATIAFVAFSTILLGYRLKQAMLERRIVVERVRLEATERLAIVLLAVRDLSNTPLQTIALAADVARTRHPDLAPFMDRIDRSIARMRDLDQTLRQHEHVVKWSEEASLDAVELTRRGLAERVDGRTGTTAASGS
jgi:hypothetical protein